MAMYYDTFELSSGDEGEKKNNVTVISSDSDFEDTKEQLPEHSKKITRADIRHAIAEQTNSAHPDVQSVPKKQKSIAWFSISIKKYNEVLSVIENSMYFEQCKNPSLLNKQHIIFNTILECVEPCKIIPCLFSEYQDYFSFYVFDCAPALNKLHDMKYICVSKTIPELKLKLIVLPTSPYERDLDVSSILQKSLKWRFNTENNTLDLSNFSIEIANKKKIYFPLWYAGNQKALCEEIEDILPPSVIDNLNLSNNELSHFKGFDMNVFGSLQSLIVSHNQIESIRALAPFQGVYVKSFTLEFNPICHNYIQRNEYIQSMKLIFPRLCFLDGHDVSPDSLPSPIKNYSSDKRSTPLIGKFLEVFYTLFDSEDRGMMMDLYTKEAIFSINCNKDCSLFYKKARNILDSNSYNIFVGPRSIIGCLCWIPQTEHDPLSFCVDVMHYSDLLVVFHITGLFKLPSEFITQNEPVFQFMRSFVLVPEEVNVYKIANDMFNIQSMTNPPHDAFKLAVKIRNKLILTPTETLSDSTKKSLVEMLMKLTNLSTGDAYHCLTVCQWNFQTATKHAITIINSRE